MTPSDLTERTRRRLVALLKGDHPDPHQWLTRLREMRGLEEVPACAATVRILTHLDLPEDQAERLLESILAHRRALSEALGRDPGLRVAAMDFLSNVDRKLSNPKIVEMSDFERTERFASRDPLTRLHNRRFFLDALHREIRRSRRYRLVFSVGLFDLDGFKSVNDEYGHLFGDLVLQRAARLLRHAIREADAVGRYGGEEFAVLLPETPRLGAYKLAERVRARIEACFSGEPTAGRTVPLTCSAGIATWPEDGDEPLTLLARADEALYLAKKTGKNRVVQFHHERRESVRYPVRDTARIEIESMLGGGPRPATPVNVSAGGALLETQGGFDHQEKVRLHLDLASPGTAGSRTQVPGHVVRVDAAESAFDGRVRVGIVFDQPLPEGWLSSQIAGAVGPGRAMRGGGS